MFRRDAQRSAGGGVTRRAPLRVAANRPLTGNSMIVFHTKRRVEFGDTDMAGIVHFANFFRFMESAECEFLRSRGLSVKLDWEGQAIGFPRVSATCDYVSPARFEDLLDVSVSIDRVGAKSVTYAFEFARD